MNQEGSNLNVVRVLSDRYWVDFSGRSDPRGISGSVLFVSGASEESAGPDTSLQLASMVLTDGEPVTVDAEMEDTPATFNANQN